MSWLRRRKALVAVAVVVLVVAVGVWLAIARGGDNERGAPEILNKPTDARRHRPIRPVPTPGFAPPEIEREKHGESESENE